LKKRKVDFEKVDFLWLEGPLNSSLFKIPCFLKQQKNILRNPT
jgi:hypothetical protein